MSCENQMGGRETMATGAIRSPHTGGGGQTNRHWHIVT